MAQDNKFIRSLVENTQRGNDSAFKQLYDLNSERIYALCLRMLKTREKAQKVAISVFVEAWNNITRLRDDVQFSNWLIGIAIFKSLSIIREEKNNSENESEKPNAANLEAIPKNQRNNLERFVFGLPDTERIIFVLNKLERYTLEEVADLLFIQKDEVAAKMDDIHKKINDSSGLITSLTLKHGDFSQIPTKIKPPGDLWAVIFNFINHVKENNIKPQDVNNEQILNSLSNNEDGEEEKENLRDKEEKEKPEKGKKKKSFFSRIFNSLLIIIPVFLAAYFVIHTESNAWKIYNQNGLPRVDGKNVISTMNMEQGEALVTDANSSAYLMIPEIGKIEIEPNSELERLSNLSLKLKAGAINVTKINAQKKLSVFVSSAKIKDLYFTGVYNVKLFKNRNSIVEVRESAENIKGEKYSTIVPANYICEIREGYGPGIPFFKNASEKIVEKISEFAFNGSNEALKGIENLATISDAVSLWNILPRVEGEYRANILESLTKIVSLPNGVTKKGILELNGDMMNKWFEGISNKLLSIK